MDTDRTASADPLDAPVGFLTPELRADLLRRWNEPQRRYHNETHLRAVLRAVDALEDLLKAGASPAVRLGAAKAVFDLSLHERDAAEIMRRLDDIERLQEQRNHEATD